MYNLLLLWGGCFLLLNSGGVQSGCKDEKRPLLLIIGTDYNNYKHIPIIIVVIIMIIV